MVPKFLKTRNERILFCKNYKNAEMLMKIKMQRVCVLGAGHIGVEMAFALVVAGAEVFLTD